MHSVQAGFHLIRDSVSAQTVYTEIEATSDGHYPREKLTHDFDALCGDVRIHQKTPA